MAVAAAALTVASLAPMAACGGGSGKSGTFSPSGSSASPSAPSDSDSEFPDGAKIVFESLPPSNPDQARIINDFQYFWRAYYYAAHTRGKDRRYLKRIETIKRGWFIKSIAKMKKRTPAGTIRFYRTRVSAVYGRGTAVETCVDVSASTPAPASRKAVYKAETGLRRGDDGTWRIGIYKTHYLPAPQAKECQR